MSTLYKQLQGVDERTKLIVNGYVRNIQQLLANWTIPTEIIDQCIAFYFIKILWDLERLNQEEQCTIIDRTSSGWVSIPINQYITIGMCNIFEISVKSIENTSGTAQAIFIGFVRDKVIPNNSIFCYGHNKPNAEAIKIYRSKVTLNSDYDTRQTKQLSKCYEKGDTIKMIFNFKEDNCKWYFNEETEPLVTRPLNGTNVFIPLFCCYDGGCKYEMTNYCFK